MSRQGSWRRWGLSILLVGVAAGCRTATRVTQVPRVDLELSEGNRGYLVGSPPPVSEAPRTTREMMETTVELPSLYTPTRGRIGAARTHPVGLGEVAPPELDMSEEELPAADVPESAGTYVVKPGDTLWSIAAQPSVFGDATKWRRLFEANRDILKSPDRLRAGMTLRIPGGQADDLGMTADEPVPSSK